MKLDFEFLLKSFLTFFLIYLLTKTTLWLFNYAYRVWVYSYLPGSRIIPFLGNALEYIGLEKSGMKLYESLWD